MPELEEIYPRVTTNEFARRAGKTVGQVRRWAKARGLRKSKSFLRQIKKENALLQWARRVPCATDRDGLVHAIAGAIDILTQSPNGESLRMRCGARFVPKAMREKDFPACVKCDALVAAAYDKPKSPPVEASVLHRKNRHNDKCKDR